MFFFVIICLDWYLIIVILSGIANECFSFSSLLFSLSLLFANCISQMGHLYFFRSSFSFTTFSWPFLQRVVKRNPMRRHLRTILNTQPYTWEILLQRQGNSFDNIIVTNMLIIVIETANLSEPATGMACQSSMPSLKA